MNSAVQIMGNPTVLVHQPRVRKPRSQEVKVVLASGPLTIIQVKTSKGAIAYQFRARSRKYAYLDDMQVIASKLFRSAYPRNPPNQDKLKARKHRHYMKKREHYLQKQRERRAMRNYLA